MASHAAPSTHRIRVLLVDDQAMIGEAVRRMLLASPEIEFRYCGDPTVAIAVAAEFLPTVILQDLVMPDVDGLTMLKFYRANPATRDVPVIVLSTKEEPKVKAEAFTLGAHDYLVKLPDPVELVARIRHHSQGFIAQMEKAEAHEALQRSEARLADELAQAAKYVASMLPARLQAPIQTDWAFVPSVELGGDAFGYHWIDDRHFAIYLLDVCGHGLKSALLSISAINVIRNHSLTGADFCSPASVLSAMNEVFQMERHDDMYFTMWYGVFEPGTRLLTWASGGHPPAILLAGETAASAAPEELGGMGMLIGGMPGTTFGEHARTLPPYARLFVFSDGVYEIGRPDGTTMSFSEFVPVVSAAPRDERAVQACIERVRAIRGQESFEDDVSMMALTL